MGESYEEQPPANGRALKTPSKPLTMGDIALPKVASYTSPIVLSPAAREYELKPVYINLLPPFHGLPDENSLDFIREFSALVSLIPTRGVPDGQLRMKFFPICLMDEAKTWFLSLEPNSLTNWDMVCEKFINRYYSTQTTNRLRREIANFEQLENESFNEAWERYRSLLRDCPHHNYGAELVMIFFYDSLIQNCKEMVDIAARGNFGKLTAPEAKQIMEELSDESRHTNSF